MTPPEHDRANWHLLRVGMSNLEIVINLALTFFTCLAWLPFFGLWWLAVHNRRDWVYVPPGTPIPGQQQANTSRLAANMPWIVIGAFTALLAVAVVIGATYGETTP